MTAIIPKGTRNHIKSVKGVVLLGVDLKDAKEEIFVRFVCDGLALGVAYVKAGFASTKGNAPSLLFALPRIQERAAAILEARRTQGVVTLPEVTDMLKRVFAGAHAAEEYSAAHNAAFSLARLYGHVTDKATLEVIRRPSRDPDAPSEQVLSDWVASLPVVSPDNSSLQGSSRVLEGSLQGPPSHAPAEPLGPGPGDPGPRSVAQLEPCRTGPGDQGPGLQAQLDLFNTINNLAQGSGPDQSPGGTGNGAPSRPVTGAPHPGAHSELLGPGPAPVKQKGAPVKKRQVPVKKRVKKRKLQPRIPSAKDLFG